MVSPLSSEFSSFIGRPSPFHNCSVGVDASHASARNFAVDTDALLVEQKIITGFFRP